MALGHRTRVGLIGTCAILVALIAIAFAVGGSGTTTELKTSAGLSPATPSAVAMPRKAAVGHGSPAYADSVPAGTAPRPVVAPAPGLPGQNSPAVSEQSAPTVSGGGTASGGGGGPISADRALAPIRSGSSLAATRIVKTGNLTIRVAKKDVSSKADQLVALATSEGGYVAQSSTNLGEGAPYGEVELRIPVAHFEDAIAQAVKLGHLLTVTRSADDVTGKYVDLSAKKHALERTRATYLSILSRARTIGATLAVQERIDEVQQQIDQLHGQLKLLANQSSYSTLTVDLVPAGVTPVAATHHDRKGIGAAWHKSWSRFGRGVDAIVGAIGPIVFAILLLALVGLLGLLGHRAARRVSARAETAAAK